MGWLHATPKPPEGTKQGEETNQGPRFNRFEQMENDGVPVRLPPNPAPHIIAWWMEIGPTEAAGMGAGPISWPTIKAWQDTIGVVLNRWEARLIRKLSLAYLKEGRLSEAENHPAPWYGEVTERERELELERLEMVLG